MVVLRCHILSTFICDSFFISIAEKASYFGVFHYHFGHFYLKVSATVFIPFIRKWDTCADFHNGGIALSCHVTGSQGTLAWH